MQLDTEASSILDDFSVGIGFRHDSADPTSITAIFAVEPLFAWKAGDPLGDKFRRSTYWYGELFRGSDAAFEQGLEVIEPLLNRERQFCQGFIESGGDIEITLNHYVYVALVALDDTERVPTRTKLAEVSLYPKFLQLLALLDIGLCLQVWAEGMAEPKPSNCGASKI